MTVVHKSAFKRCLDTSGRALKMLKRLEWAGEQKGPESYMGSNDGFSFESCPVCNGIKPCPDAETNWTKDAIGHKPRCSLSRLLRDLSGIV